MLFNLEKLLFFDIESVSQNKDLYELSEKKLELWFKHYESFRKKVTTESRLPKLPEGLTDKDGFDFDKFNKETFKEVYQQTAAFFPEFGKVACVSMAYITKKGHIKFESFGGDDEVEILKGVRNVFNKVEGLGFELCGHNIKGFDIPFLGKRFYINGLKPPKLFPTHNTKPWELRVLDTKDVWQFGNNWSLGSLDLVCMSLDIDSPKNGDVKGDNVNHNYWSGNHDEIKEYCEKDVKALVDMITKLNDVE